VNSLKEVVRTFARDTDWVVILEIGNEVVQATLEHPFWQDGIGWRRAGELTAGDRIQSISGVPATVTHAEHRLAPQPVFNIEVTDAHTYFVSPTKLLVHNACKVYAVKTPLALPAPRPTFGSSLSDVSKSVFKNGSLPDNFITKAEAKALGWNPKAGNLDAVAPGKSIGGDVFGTRRDCSLVLPAGLGSKLTSITQVAIEEANGFYTQTMGNCFTQAITTRPSNRSETDDQRTQTRPDQPSICGRIP
jgi:hypothetical protein